jgi:hypothetical protein
MRSGWAGRHGRNGKSGKWVLFFSPFSEGKETWGLISAPGPTSRDRRLAVVCVWWVVSERSATRLVLRLFGPAQARGCLQRCQGRGADRYGSLQKKSRTPFPLLYFASPASPGERVDLGDQTKSMSVWADDGVAGARSTYSFPTIP